MAKNKESKQCPRFDVKLSFKLRNTDSGGSVTSNALRQLREALETPAKLQRSAANDKGFPPEIIEKASLRLFARTPREISDEAMPVVAKAVVVALLP